jgi:cytochrome c oxidase subunit II
MPHIQSIIHPAGIAAARISHLWWVLLAICAGVWLAVAAATLIAIGRGRRSASTATDLQASRSVAIAGAVTVLMLLGVLTASAMTGRALDAIRTPGALHIVVTANQWWWDVQYTNPNPSLNVQTANEIHIPIGRPVSISLLSNDVIHSFWIPSLQGKIDTIPGRLNELWLQADKPGLYRGQCAEYCGAEHAKMALVVVAERPDDFEHWLAANRAPAPPPATPAARYGLDVVERGPCAMCHNITGTTAGGHTAPDLTHVASRSSIAAGWLPNTTGNLAGWIADPQHIKPGCRMPPTGLSSEELQAVLTYLETLK